MRRCPQVIWRRCEARAVLGRRPAPGALPSLQGAVLSTSSPVTDGDSNTSATHGGGPILNQPIAPHGLNQRDATAPLQPLSRSPSLIVLCKEKKRVSLGALVCSASCQPLGPKYQDLSALLVRSSRCLAPSADRASLRLGRRPKELPVPVSRGPKHQRFQSVQVWYEAALASPRLISCHPKIPNQTTAD